MSDEIESDIELYDSDRLVLNEIVKRIQAYVGHNPSMTTASYHREITERFEDGGFVVDVRLFTNEYEDHKPEAERTWYTKIVITARTEKQGEFDHDQMGHEVRSNILGKNAQGNVQKTQIGQTGFARTGSGLIVPN